MAGSQRNVSVKFTAEIQGFKRAMEEAAQATAKAKKASEDAGKAADKSAEEIAKQSLAHHAAAKAVGIQYDKTGQLVTMNGKAVSSQQAATHGLQTFSKEAYLAGRAAVAAGEDAEKAAKAAAEAEAKAAAAAEKHKESVQEVGRVSAIGGAAVLAGVGLAVKAYADFDKQMSSIDAATHETAGNMDLLRQAAIDAGADTAFSATEAAQGIEELAKAGVSTKDIIGGGLKGSLDLAAAGALGVGEAAELSATAMTIFGKNIENKGQLAVHVADLLSAAAGKAQGSVQDMGAALNQSALVAEQTGLSIEETTGALAAFASAGLTGSDAGTSFKTMLMSLTPSSKEAAKLMDDLGINAYDASGKFVGMSEYAGILQNALKDMSDEQRNATLKTIFGSDAVRAASVLYEQGAAGISKWEAAVNDAGFAADTAARKQDNLRGDLEKLGGSFDTVLIQSGSGANDVLRGLVQGLEGLVDVVGKVPAPVLAAGTGLAAIVGTAGLVGGALITIIPKIKETKDALNDLAPAGGKARGALDKISKVALPAAAIGTFALALARLAEADYMSKIDTGMGKVSLALQDVAANSPGAAAGIDSLFKARDGGKLISGVDDLGDALTRTFNKNRDQEFNDWAEGLINGVTGVQGSSQILAASFDRLDQGLADMVSSGNAEDAVKNFDLVAAAAKERGVTIEELTTKFPAYTDALKQAEADAKAAGEGGEAAAKGIGAAGAAAAGAKEPTAEVAKALDELGINAEGAIVSVDKFAKALFDAGLSELSARDASRNWSQALLDMGLQADGTGGKVGSLGTEFDNTTAKGIKNQAMFDGVAQAGIRNAQSMAAAGASNQELQGALSNTYAGLIAAAGQFGITGTKADALARSVLGVPDGVSIQSWMSSEAKRMADLTTGALNNIDGRVVRVGIETYKTTFERLVGLPASSAPPSSIARPKEKQTGGRLLGFTDGGKLPSTGPGTETTDGFLAVNSLGMPMARVDKDEWIINGRSSNRYNRELAAINAGTFPKLPGFATGGMYAAQSFAGSAASNVTVAAPAVTVMIGNEQLDARTYRVASSVVSAADRQSTYARPGRR
ncbi:phage tail tape measure protein [Arthrobacter sp. NPDC056886]|uniref:phage tail tape measure protein n=1 Tax=Arthrobacter sp. NPDC056886 TaxID=3345960 RepID=UPI00366F9BE7